MQRNQRSNCQSPLNLRKSKGIPKLVYICFIDSIKDFDSVDQKKLWKILKKMGMPETLSVSWEICTQVKKQQLELDMEQWTGSK